MILDTRISRKLFSMILSLGILFSTLQPLTAQAGSTSQDDGLRRGRDPKTGLLTFLGADPSKPYKVPNAIRAGLQPSERAGAVLETFGREFGLANPARDLVLKGERTEAGQRSVARYQQVFNGIPVIAGELVVNTMADGALLSISGEISPLTDLSTDPVIDAGQARSIALELMQRNYSAQAPGLELTEPELWIYDEHLLRDGSRAPGLVWRIEAVLTGEPVRELILVSAQDGGIPLHFNQDDTIWGSLRSPLAHPSPDKTAAPDRPDSASLTAGSPLLTTYDSAHTKTLPGTKQCDQTDLSCTGGTLDAQWAHFFAYGAYNFYYSRHGRDSLDNHGMRIKSSVRYGSSYQNAFWNGTQMVYGDGYGYVYADDVAAHELTHGVTQYESNLFYYYQSGAINESLSDVWGEAYDQLNGLGNDDVSVKWLMGEDIAGLGALRSMSDPTAYGDPDRMSSANYFTGSTDNGGVHSNSGLNNKAVALLVEGGFFNSQTIAALGWNKVLTIYYEAQTNLLTSGSDYLDLYNDLYQACLNKVGTAGISTGDCTQVRNATLAVEMDQEPYAGYNPEAGPLCTSGRDPLALFSDDFESGTDGWTLQPGWQWATGNAAGGTHMLWADDTLGGANTSATTPSVKLLASSKPFLVFKHSFGFEAGIYLGDYYAYDGGVLEYSVNSGAWTSARPLFLSGKDYNGAISNYSGTLNPLAGRAAFVDESRGYVGSQYDLSSLVGNNVRFRWRMGTDELGSNYGWSVDDVNIYTCLARPAKPLLLSPADGAKTTDYTPALDWSDSKPALDHYQLQIANDSGFTSLVLSRNNIPTSAFTLTTPLPIGQIYYWRVRAFNVLGKTKGWTAPFSFKTVPGQPALLSPAAGAQLANNQPTFDWSSVPGATSYTLQVAYDSAFSSLVFSKGPVGSAYTPSTDLPAATTLYWRVRANSAVGGGPWSAARSFDTAN